MLQISHHHHHHQEINMDWSYLSTDAKPWLLMTTSPTPQLASDPTSLEA